MLVFLSEILPITSIIIRFVILNKILTYTEDTKEKGNKVFFIILLSIYIMYIVIKIVANNNYQIIHDIKTYILHPIIVVVFFIYYKYFYDMKLVKYGIIFYLYNLYYEWLEGALLHRGLFLMMTGSVVSSKEALVVSDIKLLQVDIAVNVIIVIIYIIFSLIFKKVKSIDQNKKHYVYLLFALLANMMGIMTNYISHQLPRYPSLFSEKYVFDYMIAPMLTIGSTIIILLLFRQIIIENNKKAKEEVIKTKLDMQYSHYLSIQESHMKVKKLYHDINNHIYCIENLRDNTNEVNDYINNIKDEIEEFKYIHNTGNMILDIIINEKQRICSDKNIDFTCDINFEKVNFINPMDVSSIFSNILDNAIEACDKINDNKKYIKIKGTYNKSYFIIRCENSKINNINIHKNKFITDKKDKFIHGIGIESIKSSIKKYDGDLLFEDKINEFMINIYIPIKQNTDSWVD